MSLFASDKEICIGVQHQTKLAWSLGHKLITSDTLSVSHTSLPKQCHPLHGKILLTKNLEA